jgi:hypothetical protein
MGRKQSHSESPGNGAENVGRSPLTKAEAAEAMNSFKNLTRQLLAVPREKFEAEQRIYEKQRKSRKAAIARREDNN